MKTINEKQKEAFGDLKDVLNLSNTLETPKIEKIVVSSGTGSLSDKGKAEVIVDRLTRITGQKPSPRQAKKSIASFKIRQGDIVGYSVTLRGARRDAFLDKLIHIALPRTKDFRGVNSHAVDEMGNLTIGIKEHTVFPETSDEELRDIFGLAVTLVSTADNREDAIKYFTYLGIPFKREKQEGEA